MDQPPPPQAPMQQPPMQQPPMQQPQWTPPPQQQPNWGAPGYGGPPVRPMGVTLGSIFLIVMGVLESLVGGCTVVGGSAVSQLGNGTDSSGAFGAFGGVLAGVGIFILVLGILQIVAGAGALGGRGWARWLGIVVAVIFAILLVLGGVTSAAATNGMTSGLGGIVIGVLYGLTAYAFIVAGSFFAARR